MFTNLFLRLFVKDRHNPKSPAVRTAIGKLAGFVGIGCNLLLFGGKLTLGILCGSVSVTADALNNLTDAASSIVTLVGFQLAKRPADKKHPYGHGRFEYLAGLMVSVLMLFIGYELMKTSVVRIFSPVHATYSQLALCVLGVSMLVKLWMSLFFRKLGKLIDSTTLQVAAADSRNDVLATGAVLGGSVLETWTNLQPDGYIGLAVALFILVSGIRAAKETASPLLGAQADAALSQQLSQMILSHDKIIGIHDLLIHDYGPGQCYASVHAELSAQYEPMVCHDILDHIENEALNTFNIQLVIHFDPVSVDDKERLQIQQSVLTIVQTIDSDLSVHDLRLDRNSTPHLVSFDLAIPFSADPQCTVQQVHTQLQKQLPHYDFQIQVDRT